MAALTGPLVGREVELAELDERLGALTSGARPALRSRASRGSARPGCWPSSASAPRRGGASSSPAPPRSSSAICRSACGPTRSMPTSPRRRSTCGAGGRRTWCSSSPESFRRCGRPVRTPGVGGRRALPRHRAIRRLLEFLAADRPLVLALDHLHWSDAGVGRAARGAAAARRPDAPVLSRSPSARARRRRACPPRSRSPRCGGSRSASSARPRRASCSAFTPRAAAASTATAAATRSTSSSSRARARTRGARGAGGTTRAGVPTAVAASLAEELAALRRPSARCWRPRPSPAIRSSPTSRRRSPGCRRLTALDGARRAARAGPRAPDRRAAPLRLPPPARAPRGLRVGAGRLAARRPCARGGGAGRRAAPAAERAHHVEQSARRATRRRSRCCWRPARRPRRARRRRPRTGTRRRCGCCRRATASGRSRCGSRSRGRCARSGELERCRAMLLEALELSRRPVGAAGSS